MQYCRIISLDNNNSVKFTSSKEDNSTTSDSMVMKTAHAQFHMYTNIMNKFQSSTCKTVEKLRTKLSLQIDERMDEWMDSHTGDSSIPASTSLWGYNNLNCLQDFRSIQVWEPLKKTMHGENCLCYHTLIEIFTIPNQTDKIVSTDRWIDKRTDGHENCICRTSYTRKHNV